MNGVIVTSFILIGTWSCISIVSLVNFPLVLEKQNTVSNIFLLRLDRYTGISGSTSFILPQWSWWWWEHITKSYDGSPVVSPSISGSLLISSRSSPKSIIPPCTFRSGYFCKGTVQFG